MSDILGGLCRKWAHQAVELPDARQAEIILRCLLSEALEVALRETPTILDGPMVAAFIKSNREVR